MKDDMNMGYALGGEVDAIDPVSGNEIPPGSTAKEVRDDIPAMLSEGEYVVPADVLKFYGLRFFEGLRNKAKIEMAMLEEDGRMGGQPTPEGDDLTEDEMRLLDEVMGMAEGGMTPMQPQPPQPMMMGQQMPPPKPQPTSYNKPVGFDEGGMTDAFGNPIGPTVDPIKPPEKLLQDIDPTSTNIYGIDKKQTDSSTNLSQEDIGVGGSGVTTGVSGGGMKTVFYIHKDGRRISVLMLNGKPISSVPADFGEFMEDTPENRIKLGIGETGEPETQVGGEDQQKVTTEGSSGTDPDKNTEVYKASARTKADAKTPEGAYQLYEESGVSVKDLVGQSKKVLGDTTNIPKGAGILAGAINPVLGIGLGIGQAADKLTAVSKAQANKQMAEFLGKTDEANAIQAEIDTFVKNAPGVVGALDDIVASGDQRFAKALEAAFSVNAPDEMVIYNDNLNDVGKANVAEYLKSSYEGATIGDDGKIRRESGLIDKSLRPKARPDDLGKVVEETPEITKRTKVEGKYNVSSNKKLSGGYDTSTLSSAEQKSFDNAVDKGDANVADHFAKVNRHRNKQDEYAASGFDKTVGRSLGLNDSSMEQAEKYGGSVQTAVNEGRAEKGKTIFSPVVVTDTSKSKSSNTVVTSNKKSNTVKSSNKSSGSSKTSTTQSKIKSGDTLSAIAKKNNTTVAAIMKENPNIKDANKIKAGASINIPKKSSGGGGSSGGSSKPAPAKSSGGGCFLTTAIVDIRGEADDGPTLTKLRNFRDTYMSSIPSDIEEYNEIAPKIVASIPKDHKDWDWIGSQIDKSVNFIDSNLLDDAYKTYKDMVRKLEKDWL